MTTALTPEQIKPVAYQFAIRQETEDGWAITGWAYCDLHDYRSLMIPKRALYDEAAVKTLQSRIEALEAELAKLRDSECDKIMAMSEEQITALTRMQGSNPDDVAKIGKMACDLALKDVVIQQLGAELAACKRDAERYRRVRQSWQALTTMQAAQALGLDLSKTYVQSAEQFDAAIDAAMAAQEQK